MNMIVATMISGPFTKPAGFLDHALKTVLGPLLDRLRGQGYAQWSPC